MSALEAACLFGFLLSLTLGTRSPMLLRVEGEPERPIPRTMTELRGAARAHWKGDLVDLTASEPLAVPRVEESLPARALEMDRSRVYSSSAGLPELREILARRAATGGVAISVEQVLVTLGATGALSLALVHSVPLGKEVLLPSPFYSAHPKAVELLGRKVRLVAPSNGRRVTAEDLARAVTPDTAACLLTNPGNPTGAVYRKKELLELVQSLPKEVVVFSDEVYADFLYEGKFNSMLEVVAEEGKGRLAYSFQSGSKTVGMPGWRVGALIASSPLAPELTRIASALTGPPATASQLAYAAWLEAPPAFGRMAPYRARLGDLRAALAESPLSPIEPEAGYYVFAHARSPIGSFENVLALALASGVLVAPGSAFGDPFGVRISLSVGRPALKEGLTRLVAGLQARDAAREEQP